MERYSNRVCLVTGGTRGIGLAIAERMAKEGGKVIVCSRQQKSVDLAAEKLKQYGVVSLQCDVTLKEDRARVIKHIADTHGHLDVFVGNAGVSLTFGKPEEVTESRYDRTFNINTKANFFFTTELKPLLLKSTSDPNVMLVSSVTAYGLPF